MVLAVLIAAIFAVAACGGDDDSDGGGDSASTSGETTPSEDTGTAPVEFGIPEGYEGPDAGKPNEYPEPDSCDGRVGYQNPLGGNESLDAMQAAFEAEVERLGGEAVVLDDKGDPDAQVSNFNQLLAQNVKAIKLYPLDPNAINPVLDRAEQAGVPVIAIEKTFSEDEDPGKIASQLWQGRDIEAFNQATYLASQKPNTTAATIGFAVPVPGITYFVDRMVYWAEQNGIEIVAQEQNPSDDVSGGEEAAQPIVANHPDIGGIMAYNDPSALGAAATARQAGLQDITILGMNGGEDGFGGVESGRIAATFQNDSVGLGVQAAWALCDLANDPETELPPIVVRPPTGAITQDNIDTAKTWAQQIEELQAGG